eukprot:CAMPEP_0197048754 /NCGR_PEP_ID=MMETSP1384-20130603/24034_1 /TAXON_ID=29189 /ORGANISM="Ammonia sp." /LENGTH=76 /DNA_ID=CAMNT_0042480933 /DNA_START=24 /DNA_END=254 /DNA_ORIENTATION=-
MGNFLDSKGCCDFNSHSYEDETYETFLREDYSKAGNDGKRRLSVERRQTPCAKDTELQDEHVSSFQYPPAGDLDER